MINPKEFFESLKSHDFDFFAGVPDSLLKSICAYISDNSSPNCHIIAANEGNAIALAAGHYIGSNKPAVVYMQNSGIGNAVNPLLSLADQDVYQIPMLLLIGWRGEPGIKDEPQHIKQGKVMTDLLDSINVPWLTLNSETENSHIVIENASQLMRKRNSPVAILVSKGIFEPYNLPNQKTPRFPLSREEAIQQVASLIGDETIIVSTTGMASRELFEYRATQGTPHNKDFLTVGSMGHASSIALGIALAKPQQKVVCLDGDGALLMHMGALAITGNSGLPNLLHIVINNGAHDSVGGQPTAGLSINVPAIASACGYTYLSSVSSREDIEKSLLAAAQQTKPALIEIRVNKGYRNNLGRPTTTPVQNKEALMAFLDPTTTNQ